MAQDFGRDHDLLADLTPEQQEAVTHFEGPLLILAGAGSGKTRVITRRVAWLLRRGVRPSNILAITFTNKAAGEMRQRVEKLVPDAKVWISTFHSLGAKLLRIHADRLNMDRNFTIYDMDDRKKVIKDAMEAALPQTARVTADQIGAAISKAKNQLTLPERYPAFDFFSESVSRVYPVYQRKLRDSNAVDFDDLLLIPALALRHDEELRSELDHRFRFLLIDEYQDTNGAQYEIARRLSMENRNICVVGDPDQCLPPWTLVQTESGPRRIDALRDGDRVLSGVGGARVTPTPVEKVMVSEFKGRLVRISVEGGAAIRATPNHIFFTKLRPDSGRHLVYLMWRKGWGYRLGITRGVRTSKDGVISSGLQVRANQEVADAMWILRTTDSSAEARYFEHYYSIRYGIPTMVFFVRGRRMDITQEWIDRLFGEIDTEAGALRLMADLHLDRRYPHHRPGGVTRGPWDRRYVLFTLFGDTRTGSRCPWQYHRVQMVTSGEQLRASAAERFRVRPGNRGTWRIETSRRNYHDGLALAEEIAGFTATEMVIRAKLTAGKAFVMMPASHIHPGMVVPVAEGGRIVERLVQSVDWEPYEGPVYDLSVPHTLNFVADGVVVHNSIYKFRGSDIRNILDFERDFPDARTITLEKNYRSTKAILGAASTLIDHNRQRKKKTLVTDNPQGEPVRALVFTDGLEEADRVAARVREAVNAGKRRYRDFAIFLRTNALSRTLESAFIKYGIPYQMVRGLAFYERKENRDILAYLRLLLNPKDDISFLRAVNEPARGIGKASIEHLKAYAEPRQLSLLEAAGEVAKVPAIKGKAVAGLRQFYQLIVGLRQTLEQPPDEVVRQVIERSGYGAMLQQSADDEDLERYENVRELITASAQFAREDPARTIGDFLETITLASDVDSWDDQQDHVSVMTLHAAKGLEFPVVYILAVEHGILPHARSLDQPEEIEEERRLCFVGMTRAKQELYLCRANYREFGGQQKYTMPSEFLHEIEEAVVTEDLSSGAGGHAAANYWRGGHEAARPGWADTGLHPRPKAVPDERGFYVGAIVEHDEYGPGRIVELGGAGALRRVRVRFRQGEKLFAGENIKLSVVDPENAN